MLVVGAIVVVTVTVLLNAVVTGTVVVGINVVVLVVVAVAVVASTIALEGYTSVPLRIIQVVFFTRSKNRRRFKRKDIPFGKPIQSL